VALKSTFFRFNTTSVDILHHAVMVGDSCCAPHLMEEMAAFQRRTGARGARSCRWCGRSRFKRLGEELWHRCQVAVASPWQPLGPIQNVRDDWHSFLSTIVNLALRFFPAEQPCKLFLSRADGTVFGSGNKIDDGCSWRRAGSRPRVGMRSTVPLQAPGRVIQSGTTRLVAISKFLDANWRETLDP